MNEAHRARAAEAVLAAAGLDAYHNSLHGPFVFDDPSSITANTTIRHLARWGAVLATPHSTVTAAGRPVLNLSLAVNYAISGTRVWSYHALNLIIHVLAGLALLGLLRRIGRTLPDAGWPFAFLTALLWVVHPLQTESVTYVIQRAESLMGLCYLFTLYAFARYAESAPGGRRRWAVLAVTGCLLGMGTKEAMVSAPVVALLYDRTFVAGSFREAWRRHWRVHAALASTWIVLAGLIASTGGNRHGSIGFHIGVGWGAYALTQFPAIGHYLRLCFWPHPLVFEYGTFWIDRFSAVLVPALGVGALVLATVWGLVRRTALGFAGFVFFAVLAPTSLVPGSTQMIVEHRMYLPLAAVLAVAVGLAGTAIRRWPRSRAAWLGGFGAAALGCVALTIQRNADYRDAVGLWTKTVAQRPGNVLARTLLADTLVGAGNLDAATAQVQAALAIEPQFGLAHEVLGKIRFRQGRWDDAIAQYRAAVAARPGSLDAHDNLGLALEHEGRLTEALAELHWAIRIQPGYAAAHYNASRVLKALGHAEPSREQYAEAVRLDPDQAFGPP